MRLDRGVVACWYFAVMSGLIALVGVRGTELDDPALLFELLSRSNRLTMDATLSGSLFFCDTNCSVLSVLAPETSHSLRFAETPGIGIVGMLFLPIRGLLVADGIFSSKFFGNLRIHKSLK